MKALLISEVFPPQVGGSGRWLFEVYRRLTAADVIVAAGDFPGAADFDAAGELRVTRLPLTLKTWGFFDPAGFRQYWTVVRKLSCLIRDDKPSAIHAARVLPEGWMAWMLKMRFGLPYWIYVHGEELQYGLHSRQLAWMMRRVFRGARGVIANSRNTAAILGQRWNLPAKKVHVVHPGVDASRYVPAAADESFRQRMGWSGKAVVLTVGRVEKRKGHDMLIRALPETARRVPNVLYAIAGNGPERERLEAVASTVGVSERVQFLGEVNADMLLGCYQQSDLFVLPNREVNGDFEGFGMVLVEAQACGKPVIAGTSGGTAETMRIGETGLVVDCTGPELLGETISNLLSDPARRQRMGRSARLWVEGQLDWGPLTTRTAAILGLDAPSGGSTAGGMPRIFVERTAPAA